MTRPRRFALTANDGKIVAIQETFIDPAGRKSAVPPARKTTPGPHDWNKRGLVRFGSAGGETLHVCEGVEDALSARAHEAGRVVALTGVSRLGKVTLPPGVETVVAVRDGDPPESNADFALWRGVARLMGQGVAIQITPMPSVVAGRLTLKDINDLHQHEPSLVPQLLDRATAPQGKMSDKVPRRYSRRSIRPRQERV